MGLIQMYSLDITTGFSNVKHKFSILVTDTDHAAKKIDNACIGLYNLLNLRGDTLNY